MPPGFSSSLKHTRSGSNFTASTRTRCVSRVQPAAVSPCCVSPPRHEISGGWQRSQQQPERTCSRQGVRAACAAGNPFSSVDAEEKVQYGWDPSIHEPEPPTPGHHAWAGPAVSGHTFLTAAEVEERRTAAFDVYSRELAKREPCMLTCAAAIAQATKYPHLDAKEVFAAVDALAAEVQAVLPPPESRYPLRVINTIIDIMYKQKGFSGNSYDYYADDNSMINRVLSERTGLPITLSLVFMEVASRCGLRMLGVNLPAHFMLQPDVEDMELLVDAFSGETMFIEDAEARLSALMGYDVHIAPAFIQAREGVPPRQFFMRMLNNLKQLYIMTNQGEDALRVIRLMRATQPTSWAEVRDEGVVLFSLRRYAEAADALQMYVRAHPDAEDKPMAMTMLKSCLKLQMSEGNWDDDALWMGSGGSMDGGASNN